MSKEKGTVYLTSVYSLPTISSSNSPKKQRATTLNTSSNNSISIVNKSRNLIKSVFPSSLLCNNEEMNIKQKKSKQKMDNIFKEKFYEDIENDINLKLKRRKMFDDKLLQNRVIHMKKVIGFWKCFCDYANPLFSVQKFKHSEAVMKSKEEEKHIKTDTNLPVLYTNSMMNERKHKIKKMNELNFYRNLQRRKELKIFI